MTKAKKTTSTYHVFFRQYGSKKDGYPVLNEIDKGTFDLSIEIKDPENDLKSSAGNPPKGYSFDFSWEGDS